MPLEQRRAVFLDRDGVLNLNVFYPDTQAWEAPRDPGAFQLAPNVLPALRRLHDAGFLLFVVSNQPNEALRKSAPGELDTMHAMLVASLAAGGIQLAGAYYCRHHPSVGEPCRCRKPSPYFLEAAALTHELALRDSWMVGDRTSDMECGRAAGVRTAWLRTGQEPLAPPSALVDVPGEDLPSIVEQILRFAPLPS